jgi:hypothetical protein
VTSYQSSVLNALEEVQNALANYSQEQERRDRLNRAAEQTQVAVDLATEQYRAGLVDFLSVLDAQRELYAAEDQAVQSQTTVTIDVVNLYRALECRAHDRDEIDTVTYEPKDSNRDDLTRPDGQQTNQGPRSEEDSGLEQFWRNVLQRFKERAESGTLKPGSPATS